MAAAKGNSAVAGPAGASAATAADDGVRQRVKAATAAAAATAATTTTTAAATATATISATDDDGSSSSTTTSAEAKAKAEEVAAKAKKVAAAVGSTLLWMCCSSAVIILNNQLYRRGFKYPSTVTGMGQLMSAFSGFALSAVAGQPLRPTPGPRVFLTSLFPIAVCTAASMYFGNISYLYLSVAFIQVLKAFTPAITLLLGVCVGLERPDWRLLLAIGLIAGGTAGAVLVESGAPSFKWIGVIAFMASSLTEAARVVGAELLNAAGYGASVGGFYLYSQRQRAAAAAAGGGGGGGSGSSSKAKKA
eukprot:XP_001696026.1 predicted protein [Chlamydomonas reinhardtii]